jgi:hypothetical protein
MTLGQSLEGQDNNQLAQGVDPLIFSLLQIPNVKEIISSGGVACGGFK